MNNDYSFENFQKRRDEIKKKKNGETKTPLELFVYTFASVLLGFLVIATIISPRLNIPALNDDKESMETMGSSDFKSRVDYRLQKIKQDDTNPAAMQGLPLQENPAQMQDAMNTANSLVKVDLSTFNTPQLPSKNSNNAPMTPNFKPPSSQKMPSATQQGGQLPAQPYAMQKSKTMPQASPTSAPYVPKTQATTSKNYKILVGDYATPEDAQNVANMFAASSSTGAKPMVKSHNGLYSVQVGVYSDSQKAQNLAGAYKAKNYKVKVVEQ